ncbi:MAG: hypothetical protein KGQ41_09245 [Alphaproteobacteria bacterium]|nr:hypothetical protein [Alphaproteobacteria bacterium]
MTEYEKRKIAEEAAERAAIERENRLTLIFGFTGLALAPVVGAGAYILLHGTGGYDAAPANHQPTGYIARTLGNDGKQLDTAKTPVIKIKMP